MKKKFILIRVVLIGFVLAVTVNSWAQRDSVGQRHQDRGGNFQKWDKPAVQKFERDRGRVYRPGNPHNRPAHHFRPHLQKRHQIHKLHRYWRPGLPKWRYWRHHRPAVINRHYGSAENAFQASAAISDSGFAVSVGVSQTN
jgi:hypothetical protein